MKLDSEGLRNQNTPKTSITCSKQNNRTIMVSSTIREQFRHMKGAQTQAQKAHVEAKKLEYGLYLHPKVLQDFGITEEEISSRRSLDRPQTADSHRSFKSTASGRTLCAQDFYSSFLLRDNSNDSS